jgi:hypothetical protein
LFQLGVGDSGGSRVWGVSGCDGGRQLRFGGDVVPRVHRVLGDVLSARAAPSFNAREVTPRKSWFAAKVFEPRQRLHAARVDEQRVQTTVPARVPYLYVQELRAPRPPRAQEMVHRDRDRSGRRRLGHRERATRQQRGEFLFISYFISVPYGQFD